MCVWVSATDLGNCVVLMVPTAVRCFFFCSISLASKSRKTTMNSSSEEPAHSLPHLWSGARDSPICRTLVRKRRLGNETTTGLPSEIILALELFQKAQRRSYVYASGPKVYVMERIGAINVDLGLVKTAGSCNPVGSPGWRRADDCSI